MNWKAGFRLVSNSVLVVCAAILGTVACSSDSSAPSTASTPLKAGGPAQNRTRSANRVLVGRRPRWCDQRG